ncbi:hypothetical protein [Syntrophomonas erecta]
MGYSTKNYTEQGGEKTVIGGILEVKEGGSLELKEGALIKGFPIASNQNNSTATTVSALKDNFNDLLAKLKDAGFMEFDTWNLSVAKAPITTEGLPTTVNQSKVTAVTIADNIISVTVDVNELVEFESSTPTQGTHKWVGILITTGLTDITKIKYNGYQLTQDDVLEAAGVGGTDGDIIMWLKCDEIVETPKLFTLWSSGYEETELMVEIVAPAGE